jgi:hypothetical protein
MPTKKHGPYTYVLFLLSQELFRADVNLIMTSAMTTELPLFPLWNSLPMELKLMVMSHNLSNINVPWPVPHINEHIHMNVFDQYVGPYLKTRQRELYALARDTYYANNVFEVIIPLNEEWYDSDEYYKIL